MPKTLTGAELQLDDAPARGGRALPRRREQPRLPRVLRAPRGAGDDRGLSDERAPRLHQHALQAPLRLPAAGRRGRLGHEPGAPEGARRRVQDRPATDARPPARAVPALPADRRGLRVPEPRVRGLGGGRRHRHARVAGRRGGREDVRRLDRSRRVPALHGERLPDDDAARRGRRPRLHARPGLRALRRHARAGARLHRAQGRHVRQHPRRSRHRGQDRGPAHLAVRLARGRARARRRALAGTCEEPPRARRPGARVEGAGHDAPRPPARRRPGPARPLPAGPLPAEGDLPTLRVPQPARSRGRAGRGDPGGAGRGDGRRGAVGRGRGLHGSRPSRHPGAGRALRTRARRRGGRRRRVVAREREASAGHRARRARREGSPARRRWTTRCSWPT